VTDAGIKDSLAVAVMDALTSHICVVDPAGVIIAVNRAWMSFSEDNSGDGRRAYAGVNYLDVCRQATGPASAGAREILAGMEAVLKGETDLFQIEYPCHSPNEFRWFIASITPLRRRGVPREEGNIGAVVSHIDITDRKLAELDYAKLASTDPLTSLPNRRFFDEYAALEFDRFRRFGGPMSLLMLDLDRFKGINDGYGHAAGDEVLRRVAARCKKVMRGADLFARIGGEEFAGLLPGTDEKRAIVVAEKLRQAIHRLRIKLGPETVLVTASVGVAAMLPRDRSPSIALARADEALYRAKRAGRNCVRGQVAAA
jgi:diguanylate cyclase (GGDEF)-like protein